MQDTRLFSCSRHIRRIRDRHPSAYSATCPLSASIIPVSQSTYASKPVVLPRINAPPDTPHALEHAQVLAARAEKHGLRHIDNHLVHVGEGPGRLLPGEQHVAV
ncbi:hypothetical protein J3459_013532 [Metarhizium acridum]|nr:hypothetical protein J3459_013532 [Metarhizium acridum]